ncbi:TetR/AcrR family transcriptional regulator [Saccharothrix coeruleofusca]|uniref:TetR family transcriptional regulator n=1 Tax=Saccharothrix coeruleofusca TaxID=33919 RepID=A0A918AR98_9PSEU|nr:TetR family transcriptional regulator [Saccharothrix coeruleofusca]MBP2334734.1 AcrR family transcriptional regulator [Saccharothrix coeruleofusca]GGP74563.1 TetR family transcriptional regulator [Saccharothrix coeruleofusca]
MATTQTRRRADAERNIAAILDAALAVFTEEPQSSMAAIARAAGVGRVTLYAHFASREVLLEAVLDRTIAEAGVIIAEAELAKGSAVEALRRLLRTSWHVLDQHRKLFDLAQRELGSVQLRQRHREVVDHVEGLLARGQQEGVIRADLPISWLVTTVYSLLHAAAEDVNSGQLKAEEAADVLEATLLPALRS